MWRVLAMLAIVATGLGSAGCTALATTAIDQIDQAISTAARTDCELVRVIQGEDICHAPELAVQPTVYCYRSLGDVVCYDERQPRGNAIVDAATDPPARGAMAPRDRNP